MRVAALYDIHGNLPALRAVLAELESEGVEGVAIGGDVVAGPLPGETIDVLIGLGERARLVRGNGEREALDAYDERAAMRDVDEPARRAAVFTASRITPEHRDFLASFAERVVLDIDGLGRTLFCHGSPRSDTEEITTATSDGRLEGILEDVEERVVVCGHTHRQFDRVIGARRVINAGSVGMPYEGRAGAYWALLGPGVELRRTDYDLDRALADMRTGGFAELDEMLRESLLDPADPDEVAALFERQALAAG